MVVLCTLCEGMEDLEPFYPERMASRILGMGDIATFLEKAQVNITTVYNATNAVLCNFNNHFLLFQFVLQLLNKFQGALDLEKTSKLGRKMQTGDFDFDDYLLQVQSVKKMGGMQSMMKMIPGKK